jgi:hypothetical protein
MSLWWKKLVTDTKSPLENYLESNHFESKGEVITLNASNVEGFSSMHWVNLAQKQVGQTVLVILRLQVHMVFARETRLWHEYYTLLGYYSRSSGNSLPTFQHKTSVRNYHYSLHNNPEPCSSHLRCCGSLKSCTDCDIYPVLTANVTRGLLFDGFGRTPWMAVKFTKPVYTHSNKATVTSSHIQRCINTLVKNK